MSFLESETVEIPKTHPDGKPAEPFELRDAVALAVHRLFDLRNPVTARLMDLPPLNEADPEPRQIEVADPFTGWHLDHLEVAIVATGDTLAVVATCPRDE